MKVGLKITYASVTLALLGGCGRTESALTLPDLRAYHWNNRILVLDTPAADTPAYRASLEALVLVETGLRERDLILITQFAAPTFRVRLVGKDGGVKADFATPVHPPTIFAIIDAMPMRRAEKAQSNQR